MEQSKHTACTEVTLACMLCECSGTKWVGEILIVKPLQTYLKLKIMFLDGNICSYQVQLQLVL